jgi:hypothetical protein
MNRIVLVLNALGALISAGFGVVALLNPALILPGADISAAVEISSWAYAVRAIPLGVALLILLTTQGNRGLVPVLVVSGVAQIGDAVIGAIHGIPNMLFGGSTLAILELGTAAWLLRKRALAPSTP